MFCETSPKLIEVQIVWKQYLKPFTATEIIYWLRTPPFSSKVLIKKWQLLWGIKAKAFQKKGYTRRTTKMIKGLNNCHTRTGWKEWEFLTCNKDVLREEEALASLCKYLIKNDAARFFSLVHRERTRGNWHKLKHRKFHLNVKIIYGKEQEQVAQREHGNRLLRKNVQSSSLNMCKTQQDTVLGSVQWMTLVEQIGLDCRISKYPF